MLQVALFPRPSSLSTNRNPFYFCPDIFFKKKQRRKHSVNRNFYCDYIGLDDKYVMVLST